MNAAAQPDSAGYITDLPYASGFFRQQAPAFLAYMAAINGYAPPPLDRPFTYCELGCGRGLTSVILAATHPAGEFHATDLQAAHIEYATRLAAAGGVGNLRLYAKSVREFGREDLPQFDFITLHGLWSWVPDAVREEIVQFIRDRLTPGGLVMVSYNAMPGWATLQPLRDMMHAYVDALEGSSQDKAAQALGYLLFLADNGAAYFGENPRAKRQLAEMLDSSASYVAHEFITPHGEPFYFAQVNARMIGAGLAYVGSMLPEHNYAVLAVPEAFAEMMRSAPTRAVFETHRDFVCDTRFRYDLYAAQPAAEPSEAPRPEQYRGLHFAIQAPFEMVALTGRAGEVEYDLSGAAQSVRLVFERLERGPASAEAIHAALPSPGAAIADTLRLIQQLVLARALVPCPGIVAGPGRSSALNAALLAAALEERQVEAWLAAPAVGMGYPVEVPFALALEAASREANAEAAAEAALGALERARLSVRLPEQPESGRAATPEEARAYFERAWRALRDPQSADRRFARTLGLCD